MMAAIDLDHLDKYVLGDRALLDEILTIFIDQAEMLVSRLDAPENNDSWREIAHTLKGASRGVGAWTLGDLAEHAEKLAAGVTESERRELLKEIRCAALLAIEFARNVRDKAA